MNQPSIGTNASFISRHCPYQKPLKNGPPLYILYCTVVLKCILYIYYILSYLTKGEGEVCAQHYPVLPHLYTYCSTYMYTILHIILPHRGGRGSLCPALPCPPPPHPAVTWDRQETFFLSLHNLRQYRMQVFEKMSINNTSILICVFLKLAVFIQFSLVWILYTPYRRTRNGLAQSPRLFP